jgi:hypothetical protein
VRAIPRTVLRPAGETRRGRRPRRGVGRAGARVGAGRAAVLGALLILAGGVAMAVAWWQLAPTAQARVQDGQVLLQGHQELQVAQDGWFVVVAGAAGVLVATVLALRPSRRPVTEALLAAAGLGLAGVLAWRLGSWLGPAPLLDQVRGGSSRPRTPLALHTMSVLLVAPLLFSITRFLGALFTGDPAADAPGR